MPTHDQWGRNSGWEHEQVSKLQSQLDKARTMNGHYTRIIKELQMRVAELEDEIEAQKQRVREAKLEKFVLPEADELYS